MADFIFGVLAPSVIFTVQRSFLGSRETEHTMSGTSMQGPKQNPVAPN